MAKIKKTIFIILAVLAAVGLLSALQILIHRFNNPIDQPGPDISGNACLIWGAEENESAIIPAKASLTRKHYVFGNNDDGICLNKLQIADRKFLDGDTWIYWNMMQNEQGAAIDISGDEDFNFFYSSADMDILIFGVCDASRMIDGDSNLNLSGKKAVLVMPADNRKTAHNALYKARSAEKSGEFLKEWLAENQLEDLFSFP